jgi:hypothetical protein
MKSTNKSTASLVALVSNLTSIPTRKTTMKTIASLVFIVSSLISIPSQAALIKFDVGSLVGFFSSAPLTGSFVLDTNNQSVSDISLLSGAGIFDSGAAIDNASGFGLAATSFLFSGAAELLFEMTDFDRFMPNLAVGQSTTVDVFVSQADAFNGGFQNTDPFSPNSDVFQGSISATRLNEVPAPAGLGFLAMLGGLVLIKRRRMKIGI